MDFNKVCIVGRLTRDPELKSTTNGHTVLSFSLAVNRARDRETADFIPCKAFDKTAELIARYMRKGSQMLVCGSFQSSKVKDKTYYEILVNEVSFGEKASGDSNTNSAPPVVKKSTVTLEEVAKESAHVPVEDFTADIDDEDLPF